MNTRQAIIDKVHEVVALARVKFPAYKNHTAPKVEFFTVGTHAGQAIGTHTVRFNLTAFEQDLPRFINDTVPHEIAHTVCFALGLDRGHGRNWKNVCSVLGGNSKRCYSADGIELKRRGGKQYEHRATCGTVMLCSVIVHNRIMSGRVYTLKATKGKLTKATFTGVCK